MKPMKAGMGFVLCLFLFGCTPGLISRVYWCLTWVFLMLSPASSYQEALKISNQQSRTKRHYI